MNSNTIIIKKVNINELLKETNGAIIPYYQRNYEWSEKEIERLIYDLISNNSNEYFFGSITLCDHLDSKKIVDGQQRISTFLLIIKYLKEFLKINNKNDNFFDIKKYKIESNNLRDKNILEQLIQCDENEKIIEINEKFPNSRYIENFKIISDLFKKTNIDMEKFISVFENVIFSLVIVTQDYDEYRLFTNINSTGLPLNAFELVKNFIFSKMDLNEKEVNVKLEVLHKISNYLEIDENSNFLENAKRNQNLNNLIRLFNAYEEGFLEKSEPTMLFRKFEKIYKENYDEDINKMFEEFIKFSAYYKFIQNEFNDEKYNFYKSFRIIELQFDTYITLIINILKNNSTYNRFTLDIKFTKEQEKEIERSLLVVESFALFRSYCNFRSNDLTRFIPLLQEKLEKYINKYSYSASLFKTLYFDQKNGNNNTIMPSKNEFLQSLIDNDNIYKNKKKQTEKLLIRIDEHLNENVNRKNTTKYTKIHIEHILPQDYQKWIEDDSNLNENNINKYINSIGNLTILPEKLNIELSNNIFKIKKESLLEKGTFIINNYLNKKDKWTINEIDERAKWLISIIDEIYNLDDLFRELGEPLENLSINFNISEKKNKNVDIDKIWRTLKINTKKFNIKITYERIKDLIIEYCLNNKTQSAIARNIFEVKTNNNGLLVDRNYTIWSIFKILDLDDSNRYKSKEWVNQFIEKNEDLIYEIINECN